MIKLVMWLLFLGAGSYGLFCAFLYSKQRSILYYPTPEVHSAGAEALWLSNEDESLKIWHVPASGKKALIYFGGNAEDVALNIDQFKTLFSGYSLYLQNYRGYGGSSGRPTEKALFSDSLALFDHIAGEFDSITVMGRSLGTGIALFLASKRSVAELILVTPYDSMVKLAASYYPFVPVSLLMKDRFEASRLASGVRVPTLVLIAEYDEVIPRKRSDALVQALKQALTNIVVVREVSHNTIGSSSEYELALQQFANRRDRDSPQAAHLDE